MLLSNLFDSYGFRARLQPALFTLLPLGIGAFAWINNASWLSALWGIIVAAGGTYFLSAEIRNAGKKIEEDLWEQWGGTPTTRLLSHFGKANPEQRNRWHVALEQILGTPFPSRDDEKRDPERAEEVYVGAVRTLIAKTRGDKRYPWVNLEVTNYGYCRNLYGFRKQGIICSLVGLASSLAAATNGVGHTLNYLPWTCSAICVFLTYKWAFSINPEWVKVSAFAFANRLLEASEDYADSMKSPISKPKKRVRRR